MSNSLIAINIVTSMMESSVLSEVRTDMEHECLARTAYYEARGESIKGKIAVVYTILNRAKQKYLKASEWCTTLKAPGQYQWAKEYESLAPMNKKDKIIAYQIAYSIAYGKVKDPTNGAIYFYNPDKSISVFHEKQEYLMTIGGHRFFK